MLLILLLALVTIAFRPTVAHARKGANYDEGLVPTYTLPDPLLTVDGLHVTDCRMWRDVRRPEIVQMLAAHVYGETPVTHVNTDVHVFDECNEALNETALRHQARITFTSDAGQTGMDLLLYTPRGKQNVPIFLGLNFWGNHSIHPDPAIRIPASWMRDRSGPEVTNNRATEAGRGFMSRRWPIESIIEAGFGIATVYYGDLYPDHPDGASQSVHRLFAQHTPHGQRWGAIGAWSWGLSRALDYLHNVPQADPDRVAVLGHSRLGKTALWAAAQDERFAMAISNNSGCGGAALSRRDLGETVAIINDSFPHWFCGDFKRFNDNEVELPVDQHMLIAAIAPRPVYVASAQEDLWADPKGEFLSCYHADPVYALLGKVGLGTDVMPPVDMPVGHRIGYHIRQGKHDLTNYDWEQYIRFADTHFGS